MSRSTLFSSPTAIITLSVLMAVSCCSAAFAAEATLPATKSIDLGNGVMLDLVLIPAGTFTMAEVCASIRNPSG